jgi:putative MFS transporter
MTARSILDDAKLSRFHVKTAAFGTAGQFCDGYILGIIAPALPVFARTHEVSPVMAGLLGASALVGLFVGSLVFGWLTDRIGRRRMFVFDLLAFVLLSLAQLAVTDSLWLLVLRFLLGIAVGADYSIAPTLVAEFAPRRYRAALLAAGPAMWTIGYVLAFAVGAAMASMGDDSWRWMLATSAIPAAALLLMRVSTPESPRWLIRNGRADEALAILRKHVKPDAQLSDLDEEPEGQARLRDVFAIAHRRRLAFACLFWFCQVVPYFAVFTFLPDIFGALTVASGFWQTMVVNLFLLIGGLLGIVTIDLVRRRTYTLTSFTLLLLSTLAIGLWHNASATYVIVCIALFALVSSALAALDTVYPSEMFPTSIRATATGICVAFSRIGAAIGTFLLPIGMSAYGVHTVTLIAAGIVAAGLWISAIWAPETRGLTLTAAGANPPSPRTQATPASDGGAPSHTPH